MKTKQSTSKKLTIKFIDEIENECSFIYAYAYKYEHALFCVEQISKYLNNSIKNDNNSKRKIEVIDANNKVLFTLFIYGSINKQGASKIIPFTIPINAKI